MNSTSPALPGAGSEVHARRRVPLIRFAPPNWSPDDWRDEANAIAELAAWRAQAEFDPARGVPEGAFIDHRIRCAINRRYRQEQRFGARVVLASPDGLGVIAEANSPVHVDPDPFAEDSLQIRVGQALGLLYATCRKFVDALFAAGLSQHELAAAIGISQCAVSKRAHRILLCLRRSVRSECPPGTPCTGKCWRRAKNLERVVINLRLPTRHKPEISLPISRRTSTV